MEKFINLNFITATSLTEFICLFNGQNTITINQKLKTITITQHMLFWGCRKIFEVGFLFVKFSH
jgi:hypothetical protein